MATVLDDTSETLSRQASQLATLDTLAKRFGQSLDSALGTSTASGRQLSTVLDSIGRTLASSFAGNAASALQTTLTGQVQSALRSLSENVISGSFGGLLPFAQGGVVAGGRVVPFAQGGVVASPTYFPMADGMGLAGERGAEAIMPLTRGPDGRLGVQGASGGGTQITVNIAASDVDSFKRSEAQVSAALARAVARGRRGL